MNPSIEEERVLKIEEERVLEICRLQRENDELRTRLDGRRIEHGTLTNRIKELYAQNQQLTDRLARATKTLEDYSAQGAALLEIALNFSRAVAPKTPCTGCKEDQT